MKGFKVFAVLAILLIFVTLTILSSGCTSKYEGNDAYSPENINSKEPCSSKYCYCKRCDTGSWVRVDKRKGINGYADIKTVGDCALYCKNYNTTDKRLYDKGYDGVCDDLIIMTKPNCNCPQGTRCCMTTSGISKDKMQCVEPDFVCGYAWLPDSACAE
ncbi:MAG: hypothetical protein QXW00_03505 [Candidatus Woesearchaeota archaeon]